MKFLTSLLLLVATTCFGAVPDYKVFRGTGGILVTSNPPIGTITFDGSGISSPTGGVSATTATNIAISIFNQYSTTNGLTERTNVLYIECGDPDFLSKISNCPNNTVMTIGPCPQGYTFPTWAYSSNAVITPFSLRNKTNVEIHGLGMPAFISSQTPFGDTMMISNCFGITIRGIRLESLRVTNISTMPSAFTYNWSALAIINVNNLLVEGCEIVNHHDHGIIDMGAYSMFAGNHPSTNGIVIRNNIFRNIGSFFPTVDSYDGAAITISGGLIEGNHIYECGTGIEPYTPGPGTNLFTKITGNYLENILIAGIQDGGSGIHFNGIEISGNTLKQNIGYTRGGSNFLNYGYGIKTTTIGNVKIAGNTIINQQGEAILLQPGARASGYAVDNNWILNSTNHVGSGNGSAILLYSAFPLYNSSFRGNVIINSAYGGFTFVTAGGSNGCLIDSIIENNTMICPNTISGSAIDFSTSTCSNITIRGNFIRDTNATPTMWHGIHIATGLKRMLVYDNIIEGGQTGAGNYQIFNEAGDETAVNGTWPLGPTNVAALVNGSYTNNVWDRLVGIPNAATRTNRLPSAAKYFQWAIRIYDKGGTASQTNIWIATVGGQTINGGPAVTNIALNGASITLISDGANWRTDIGAEAWLPFVYEKQDGDPVLSNLVNVAATTVTNVISLSTSNATSKPLTNSFTAGVLRLFGIEAGANVTITPNGSNYVIASTGGGGGGNVSSNVAGGITAIGVSTNQNDLWALADVHARSFFDTEFLGDFALISDPVGGEIQESSTTATELGYLNNVTSDIQTQLSNDVRIVAGNGTVTVTPSGSGGIMTYSLTSAGGGATSLTNLLDVAATNMQSGDALTFLTGMKKWTNVAPFITYNLTITTTNIFVGSNSEQNVYITTNASFALIFTGTPGNGELVNVSVSNYSASTIYSTNTFYDTTVASNVTVWAIPALSERKITLQSVTNHNLGVARWELRNNLQKEAELAVAGGLVLLTNSDNSIITISNGASVGQMTRTNFVMNQIYTNTSTSPILVNASAFLVAAAVNGGCSVDLMYSPTGGISYVLVARAAMSTVITGFAVQVTNSISGVITNAGNYYFTNTSSGAGNSAGVVDNTGQVTVIGSGPAGPTGPAGYTGSTNVFRYVATTNVTSITTPYLNQNYNHMTATVSGRGTNAAGGFDICYIQVNGITTPCYSRQSQESFASNTVSAIGLGGLTNLFIGYFNGSNGLTRSMQSSKMEFPEYSETNFEKTVWIRNNSINSTNNTAMRMVQQSGFIQCLDRITNITFVSAGQWASNTIFTITLSK